MITAAQIATYLDSMHEAQTDYMDKLTLKEKVGSIDIFSYRAIAAVLNCYIKIVEDYFSQATYSTDYFVTDYNFFDEQEIKEIIFRINKICDTNYYLDV